MTTAIISAETVLLVLLVVLVAGLLRSHAEILRRLGPASDEQPATPIPQPTAAARRDSDSDLAPAPLTGTTPDGEPLTLAFEGAGSMPTLLAFLTSGCGTCQGFWDTLGESRLPPGVQTVIVAHGTDRESPSKLRKLAPRGVPVVMSSQAWSDYRVPGAPYFVLVEQTIRGEGVATTWQALASMVGDAIEDEREAARAGAVAGIGPGEGAGGRRPRPIDETFATAGIGPEHPSLYPGRRDR